MVSKDLGSDALSLSERQEEEPFQSNVFELDVKTLLKAYHGGEARREVLSSFRWHPVLKAHDIAAAAYLLSSLEEGIDLGLSFLNLKSFSSGAIQLFRFGGFPWGGLPYPAEHSELGWLLLKIGEFYEGAREKALSMLAYQQALFTHEEKVLSTLFVQGSGRKEVESTFLAKSFLYQLGEKPLPEYAFLDRELGFWMKRNRSASHFVFGSGCKSGMGAFLHAQVGLLSFGPHSGGIDSAEGFGLASRAKDFYVRDFNDQTEIAYTSRAALPCQGKFSRYLYLSDSLIGPLVSTKIFTSEIFYRVESSIEEARDYTFSFFFKGDICRVHNGPRLRASSPDSYKGPVSELLFYKENLGESGLKVSFLSCGEEIKIFSLSGGRDFWGADFLVNISYKKGGIVSEMEIV